MKTVNSRITNLTVLASLVLLVMLPSCVDNGDLTLVFPTESAERTVRDHEEIILPDKEIEMSLWDWSAVDHDSVSVFLNGRTIVNRLFLKSANQKHVVKATLDKKRNDLVILTHNEGTKPPGSLAFEIKSGDVCIERRTKNRMVRNERFKLVIE